MRNESVRYASLIPKKSSSFTQEDIVHMTIISSIYIALSSLNLIMLENKLEGFDIEKAADCVINSPNYTMLHNNFLGNWTNDNNFYYTVNFDGSPDRIPDTNLYKFLLADKLFLKMVTVGVPDKLKMPFVKLVFDLTVAKFYDVLVDDFD